MTALFLVLQDMVVAYIATEKQMASAYVGSTFIPPLFGLIANHIDIKLFPWYILIFFVLMIVMTEKTFKKVGR